MQFYFSVAFWEEFQVLESQIMVINECMIRENCWWVSCPLPLFFSVHLYLSDWIYAFQDEVLRTAHKTNGSHFPRDRKWVWFIVDVRWMLNSATGTVGKTLNRKKRQRSQCSLHSVPRGFLHIHSTHPDVLPSNFSYDNLKKFHWTSDLLYQHKKKTETLLLRFYMGNDF